MPIVKMKEFKKGMIITGVSIFVVVILAFMSVDTIAPGYAGVVYSANGGVQEEVLSQGWHIVAPWKSVTEYPVATETIYFSKNADEGQNKDTSLNIGTADGKVVNMDVSYTYHYDASKLAQVFTKFKGQSPSIIENTFIRRELKDALNKVTTQYGVFDIYGTKRSEVGSKTYTLFSKKLEPLGIIIEGFSITEVNPDPNTMSAIQEKVDAIQDLEKEKIEKQKAEIVADKLRIQAQGEADAKLIRAQGEAKANDALQLSLTKELVEYEKVKKWNGEMPKVTGGNTIMDLREK